MTTATEIDVPQRSTALSRWVRAGLLLALVDGIFSSVLSVAFYNSTVARLFQGVASVLLGPQAVGGGNGYTALGVLMHITTAFTWSAVYLFIVSKLSFIKKLLASRNGVFKVAALYGPFVWLMMSLVVIPVLAHRPPRITIRWWVQFFGHMPFVGLPIVAAINRNK